MKVLVSCCAILPIVQLFNRVHKPITESKVRGVRSCGLYMGKFLALLLAVLMLCLGNLQAQVDIANNPVFHEATKAYQSGEMEKARAGYQSLLDSYPDNIMLKNNLAVIAARQGHTEEAEKMFRDVLHSNGTIATSYHNLTALYAYQAAQTYRLALSLDTNQSELPDLVLAEPKQSAASPRDLVARLLGEAQVNEAIIQDPQAAQKKSGESVDVLETLQIWAKAWAKQDVEAYLANYIPNFKGREESHEAWQAIRSTRLRNPRFIKVSLSNIKTRLADKDSASASFVQSYQSNLIKSTVRKRVTMQMIGGKWKISSERVSG